MILAVGAVELFYEKQGKGRPLILPHRIFSFPVYLQIVYHGFAF